MSVWLSALVVGFLTAIRFAILPALALLVFFSLGWHRKRGAWIPLWKLASVLLAVALVSTVLFTVLWRGEVAP